MDELIGMLAARQHSIVGRAELYGLGLSDKVIGRLVRGGRLRPIYPGAYAIAGANLTRRSYWMAAVISAGPGAVLAQRSAAQLERLADLIPGPPHVLVPHGRTLIRPGIVIHRTRALPRSQTTVRHGIPVTKVERTLLDFAAVASPGELRNAVWAAARLEDLDVPAALDLCRRSRGRRGTGQLHDLLLERRGPVSETRSPLEDLFLPICADFGIRFPAVNVPVLQYTVDCLWLPEGLVVELDGWEAHGTRESFESDRRRDAKLDVAGHPVLRFTNERLTGERADVAADVSRMLERLGAHRTAVR